MSNCCSEINKNNRKCPKCGFIGESVNIQTVRSLCKVIVNSNNYNICYTHNCDVIYYNEKQIINKQQVIVPLWTKDESNPKYACYCSKVTEEDIIMFIKDKNIKTLTELVKRTSVMNISDCINKNPTGKCCSKHIKDLLIKHI